MDAYLFITTILLTFADITADKATLEMIRLMYYILYTLVRPWETGTKCYLSGLYRHEFEGILRIHTQLGPQTL